MNALKYILLAGVCIIGTTAVWSVLHPTLDCPECQCNCPTGVPGNIGKAGMDCQLFDDNGRLACKYADGTFKTSDIPTVGALGSIRNDQPTYSTFHLWLIAIVVGVWLVVVYRMIRLRSLAEQVRAIEQTIRTRG